MPARQAAEWVRDTAFDLWQLLHPEKEKKIGTQPARWRRPQDGWHKCNVDGAYMASSKTGATGAVLRDSNGQFQAGCVEWHARAPDALLMEALACRSGVQLAQNRGVFKLCLETDCQVLVNLWNNLTEQRSAVNVVLWDIKAASRSFNEFTFVFANRLCNR